MIAPEVRTNEHSVCLPCWSVVKEASFSLWAGVFSTDRDAVNLNMIQRNEGVCWEQSVAGATGPWGHICVLCSLSGNILIWSLCFYKTGQDLFYPWAICVSSCEETTVVMQKRCSPVCFQKQSSKHVQGFLIFLTEVLCVIENVWSSSSVCL